MSALYRKYRPKKFSDLFGQEEIRETLKNAARQDKLSHAYLFYGGRGSGKTTVARIVAKIANCETRQNDLNFKLQGEPCNNCPTCSSIDAGTALDVVEIDAASNRGIDEIRDLKEGIKLSPTAFFRKVFIIDEVHMLTREAFNALLKTLEEPPEHAMFVLATTEFEKVPATVASRTQRFYFRKLPISLIAKKLTDISRAENFSASKEALEAIAYSAEGSLRDAESLLDQVAALSTNIDEEAVERAVGKVSRKTIGEFAHALVQKNLVDALRQLREIYASGRNIADFNKEIITYLRRMLSVKFDKTILTTLSNEVTGEELKALELLSQQADVNHSIKLIQSLIKAYSEMRYSPIAIAPFEVAIIENLK